mmetsp:Transcript_25057/g.28001  ORF Transcript_25057/g.28001 Transcript_25057/m.28001 type:complete len:151 (-) Transcript_25057:103-555(-)
MVISFHVYFVCKRIALLRCMITRINPFFTVLDHKLRILTSIWEQWSRIQYSLIFVGCVDSDTTLPSVCWTRMIFMLPSVVVDDVGTAVIPKGTYGYHPLCNVLLFFVFTFLLNTISNVIQLNVAVVVVCLYYFLYRLPTVMFLFLSIPPT